MNTYLQHPCRYGPKRAKFGRDAGELLLAALLAGQRAFVWLMTAVAACCCTSAPLRWNRWLMQLAAVFGEMRQTSQSSFSAV